MREKLHELFAPFRGILHFAVNNQLWFLKATTISKDNFITFKVIKVNFVSNQHNYLFLQI